MTEQLDIATVEVVDLVHRETGQRLTPQAIERLRSKIAWGISLSCVAAVLAHEDRKAQNRGS